MERLRGVALVDLEGIRNFGVPNPETTLVNALNTWALSVVACDFFHGEPCCRNGRTTIIDISLLAIP